MVRDQFRSYKGPHSGRGDLDLGSPAIYLFYCSLLVLSFILLWWTNWYINEDWSQLQIEAMSIEKFPMPHPRPLHSLAKGFGLSRDVSFHLRANTPELS